MSGSWGMRGHPVKFQRDAQSVSVQQSLCAETDDCCEPRPAASSILAGRTAAACDGLAMNGNKILKRKERKNGKRFRHHDGYTEAL